MALLLPPHRRRRLAPATKNITLAGLDPATQPVRVCAANESYGRLDGPLLGAMTSRDLVEATTRPPQSGLVLSYSYSLNDAVTVFAERTSAWPRGCLDAREPLRHIGESKIG